jgi:hypothetical protein
MKTRFSLIFLFFVLKLTLFAQDIRVLSSSSSYIIIEYRPVFSDTIVHSISGEKYIELNLLGGFNENYFVKGKLQTPVREINIGVPSEFGNTIQVLDAQFTTLKGKYVLNPEFERDSLSVLKKYSSYSGKIFSHQNEIAQFGEFGLFRSLLIQTIKLYPVNFDSINNEIKIYNKIVIRINYGRQVYPAELITDAQLQFAVLNWDVASKWGIKSGSILKKETSILAAGPWYRFETSDEGIYKIDRTFLQNLGIDINSLDPRTIKLFSTGGYSLPENYSSTSNKKFQEVAIFIIGAQDGKFDTQDYILFYGRGTEFWEYDSQVRKVVRIKNPYSRKNYLWLTHGGTSGKRNSEKTSLLQTGGYQQISTFAYKSLDKDSINIGKSGRDYYGDEFNSTTKSRNYLTTLNGIVQTSRTNYKFRLINASAPTIQLRVDENNSQIYSTNMFGNGDYIFGRDIIGSGIYSGQFTDDRSNLKFTITTGSSNAKVYLDYFEIEYIRRLISLNDNLILFSKDTIANISYTVTNFSNSSIQVFDVTDYANIKLVAGTTVSGGQVSFTIPENEKSVSKYFAVSSNGYKIPSNGVSVTTADIKNNKTGSELIIITHKDFRTQAERYSNYRSSQSPHKVTSSIFYIDDILNEFSGGLMDPTAIRDFLKYAYDNWQIKPYYVLFLGDGDYDYLNSEKETSDKNFIPTYQTIESLDEIGSYSTDDYFARVSGNDLKIDLAIGRLNVQSLKEAETLIDKIIAYESQLEKSLWRTNITLVADDGPQKVGWDDGNIHTGQSENLSLRRIPKYFDQNKIYLAAYPTAISGLGRRKPDVNKAIINAINNGTLVLNYIGHGNPSVWAHENVFEKATTIPQMNNSKYFFLTAATCDFGKYDDPSEQSSTELMINMKNAGAIGAFTSARVVFSTSNAAINDSFYTYLFGVKDAGNLPLRIGKAYLLAKQYRTQDNDEKFHLFGDPTLRLGQPTLPVSIDSVNSKSVATNVQINALGEVKIKGKVKNSDGSNANYNGEAIISVYDSERQMELKEMSYTIQLQGGLIYRGRTNVTNGNFLTEFVVPKDISYENKNGKISAYVFNQLSDGIGITDNIIVGGTNLNAINDGKGPDIEVFYDDEKFENGYLVNHDFTLIAKLKDNTGLNTTGTGIGHKLEGILNDDENNSIDFTNFFVGDLNSGGKSGAIKYKFSSMKPGDYKIKVKAWDVFNNFSAEVSFFTVINKETGFAVRDLFNYPNPFANNTTFTFQHNLSEAINIKIKIYSVAGRLIKEIEEDNYVDKFVKIDWDGRDEDGNSIANGTYLYKIIVESVDGQYKTNLLGKLAVIR